MALHNILFLLGFPLISQAVMANDLYDVKTKQIISYSELANRMTQSESTVVIGEYHYNELIQLGEKEIIKNLVILKSAEKDFNVGWEFLEYDIQLDISDAFDAWYVGQIKDDEFLKALFPKSKKPEAHAPYLPVLEITASLGGSLIATNATRATKKIVMDQGIQALEAKDKPAINMLGSDNYWKRFKAIMGNHVPEDQIKKYFSAQYYTDNIIGTYFDNMSLSPLSFLIIGAFHTDYSDGVIRYLSKNTSRNVISIKVVNGEELTDAEVSDLLTPHTEYGTISDYLLVVTGEVKSSVLK